MKRLSLVVSVCFVVAGFIWSLQFVSAQNQQAGKITGVVEDREQKDGDQTMAVSLKSDQLSFEGVTIRLTKKLNKDARVMKMPEGCEATKDDEKIEIKNCPPGFDFKLGLEIPASYKTDFNSFTRKGLRIDYTTSDGEQSQRFPVQNTPPVTLVKPEDAAYIPQTLRAGYSFSITPKAGFQYGEWAAFVVDANSEKNEISSKIPDDSGRDFYTSNPSLDQYLKTFLGSGEDDEKLIGEIREAVKKEKERETNSEGAGNPEPDNRRYFYVTSNQLGKIQFKYINEFGETTVEDFAENTQLIQDNNPYNMAAPPRLTDCTDKVFVNREICVCGYFPDEFSQNHLLLDGKPLGKPKAGSIDNVLVVPQGLTPGKHVITWNTEAFNVIGDPFAVQRPTPSKTERVEFTVLGVEASIDSSKLFTGEGTTLRLKIIGTDEKIPIELTNNTPEIIKMQGGNKQVIQTPGGGDNSIQRGVVGIKRGDFSITYKVEGSTCPCQSFDIEKSLQEGLKKIRETQEGGGMSNVKPPPPQLEDEVETDVCEKIREECRAIGKKIEKIIEYQQKEFAKCEKLPAKEKEACMEQARKLFDPLIADGEDKFDACVKRFRECRNREVKIKKVNKEVQGYLDKLNEKTNCDELRKECGKLAKEKNKLLRNLSRKKAECRRKYNDLNSVEYCIKTLNNFYRPKITKLRKDLKDCRSRLEMCEKREKE